MDVGQQPDPAAHIGEQVGDGGVLEHVQGGLGGRERERGNDLNGWPVGMPCACA